MESEQPLITTDKLNKFVESPVRRQLLRDITMQVRRQEIVAVHGSSGSGKSTLLYILATLDTEFEGTLIINNTLFTGKSTSFLSRFRNAHLGFVFQFHYLLPEFNVLQNVVLPALKSDRWERKADVQERAASLLKELGLKVALDMPVYKLSGGEQQRVSIARALINDPMIIIADEPTGNLDSRNSKVVLELLQHIRDSRGTSVVVATHDELLSENSDRSYEMIDGILRPYTT